jgi:uncharacterized protein (TIGR00159 family)
METLKNILAVFDEFWPYFTQFFDLFLVSLLLYMCLRFLRGTRALSMLGALLMMVLLYWGSIYGRLYTLQWLLKNLVTLLPFIIIVIFQADIRRALVQVGNPFFTAISTVEGRKIFDELVRAVVGLANQRIGAIIVLERNTPLGDFVEVGTEIDCLVSKEIIRSIFQPTSPIHDGAVIIQKGRITAAGCILPLSMNPNLSKYLGTRHRAAIGLTEETDAVGIVVSEEQGKISLVVEGRLTRDIDGNTLRKVLHGLFSVKGRRLGSRNIIQGVSVT